MRKAWECSSDYYEMDAWLDDEVADGGITVAMVLDKDAPRPTEARDDGE